MWLAFRDERQCAHRHPDVRIFTQVDMREMPRGNARLEESRGGHQSFGARRGCRLAGPFALPGDAAILSHRQRLEVGAAVY